jgi:hypothetical protein
MVSHRPRQRSLPHRAGWHTRWLTAIVLLGSGLQGCGDDPGTPEPNIPPDTRITGSVPPNFGQSSNRVEILWAGSEATADDVRAAMLVPAENDPRWTRHDVARIDLVVLADTLRADPRQQPIPTDLFDRWHTFYVRTVDKDGAHDPTPAAVSFQAQSKAPVMWLQQPVQVGTPVTMPLTFVMNWTGFDPDPTGPILPDPDSTRWVLREATVDGAGNAIGYPDSLYDLRDSDWSPWKWWHAPDSTGRQAVFRIDLPPSAPDKGYVFAVQGMDDGGAVTPQFDNTTVRENNWTVVVVQPSAPQGPRVTVFEDSTGAGPWVFNGIGAPQVDVAVSESIVYMRWSGMSTGHYGASPGEFRYGWNIVNPNNDAEWTGWDRFVRVAPPHTLASSVETFQLQARDVLGDGTHQVTTASIRFLRTR